MVPRAGLEPARHFQTRDFKSLAYTISPPGLGRHSIILCELCHGLAGD
jgi:hypothetical protein